MKYVISSIFPSLRCLLRWKDGGVGYNGKWSKQTISELNVRLKQINQTKPVEIHRSLRTLDDLKFWKGTEFRSFLLYYGIVALKEHLSSEEYKHFLLLSCAARIFYADVYRNYRKIAHGYLTRYFEGCLHLYGINSIGSNVHNLVHVYEDVEKFGSLNELSTYPFENRLNFLKNRLKQPSMPLEQISRRIVELTVDYNTLFGTQNLNFQANDEPSYIVKFPYKLNNNLVYKEIVINSNFTLSTRKEKDSWFLTTKNDIIRMKYVTSTDNVILVYGASIRRKENLFIYPVSSQILHIYKSDGDLNDVTSYELNMIRAKLMFFPYSHEEFVFMPLLHTFSS